MKKNNHMQSVVAQHLNETVKCTIRPSRIGGVGVFAIRDIKEGELLTEYHYETLNMKKNYITITREEFEQINPEVQSVILDRIFFDSKTDKLMFLSPNQDAYLQTFMNHSTDPNSNGQFATRLIKKDEEITFNYLDIKKYLDSEEFHELTLNHMPFLK